MWVCSKRKQPEDPFGGSRGETVYSVKKQVGYLQPFQVFLEYKSHHLSPLIMLARTDGNWSPAASEEPQVPNP